MSKIGDLTASLTIEAEFPDIEGFIVNLHYLDRKELTAMRKRTTVIKFSKTTRQREEEIDNDKFLEEYASAAIKGWKGLKVKDLSMLLPVDLSKAPNLNEEIPYTEEEALDLLSNSTTFDQFVTDCMNDYEMFSKKSKDKIVKN